MTAANKHEVRAELQQSIAKDEMMQVYFVEAMLVAFGVAFLATSKRASTVISVTMFCMAVSSMSYCPFVSVELVAKGVVGNLIVTICAWLFAVSFDYSRRESFVQAAALLAKSNSVAAEVTQAGIIARSTLVSSVAHDLRSPLGACQVAAKLLKVP